MPLSSSIATRKARALQCHLHRHRLSADGRRRSGAEPLGQTQSRDRELTKRQEAATRRLPADYRRCRTWRLARHQLSAFRTLGLRWGSGRKARYAARPNVSRSQNCRLVACSPREDGPDRRPHCGLDGVSGHRDAKKPPRPPRIAPLKLSTPAEVGELAQPRGGVRRPMLASVDAQSGESVVFWGA